MPFTGTWPVAGASACAESVTSIRAASAARGRNVFMIYSWWTMLNGRTKNSRIDGRPGFFALAVLVMLFAPLARAVPIADGPYVTRAADGGWVARWIEGDVTDPRIREQRLSGGASLKGKSLTVPAVG